jgi:DNA-binding transcriptional MerR regulator
MRDLSTKQPSQWRDRAAIRVFAVDAADNDRFSFGEFWLRTMMISRPSGDQSDRSAPSGQGGTGEQTYSIGDLAREFGLTLRTLRFYEDRGLITPRREGQSRRYSAHDRERLAVILKGRRLGFTLTEIRAMVAEAAASRPTLDLSPDAVRDQITLLERQRAEIDEALCELRRNYEALSAQGSDEPS